MLWHGPCRSWKIKIGGVVRAGFVHLRTTFGRFLFKNILTCKAKKPPATQGRRARDSSTGPRPLGHGWPGSAGHDSKRPHRHTNTGAPQVTPQGTTRVPNRTGATSRTRRHHIAGPHRSSRTHTHTQCPRFHYSMSCLGSCVADVQAAESVGRRGWAVHHMGRRPDFSYMKMCWA